MSRLVDLPIRTFSDIVSLGFMLRVWCSGCKSTREVDVSARLDRSVLTSDL